MDLDIKDGDIVSLTDDTQFTYFDSATGEVNDNSLNLFCNAIGESMNKVASKSEKAEKRLSLSQT